MFFGDQAGLGEFTDLVEPLYSLLGEFGIRQANWEFVVQAAFQSFSQHEPMLTLKPTGVIATPQDNDQFFLFLHSGLRCS